MSTPAERDAAPPPSFVRNLARTLPFMLLCGIVGPIFLLIYLASGGADVLGWMLWTGLGVITLDVVIAVVLASFRTTAQRRAFRLRRTGRRAMADVLSAAQTGVRVNNQPLLALHLRIHGPDVSTLEIETRKVVSDLRMPLLYGGSIPVLVDPENGEWEFDWDAARPATVAPVAGTADQRPIADRLAELDNLLKRDLLSRDEYDAARARILGEL